MQQIKYIVCFFIFCTASIVCAAQLSVNAVNSDSLVRAYVIQKTGRTDFRFTNGHEGIEYIQANFKNADTTNAFIKGVHWIKADFNNDGKEDLVVNGYVVLPQGRRLLNEYRLYVFLSYDTIYIQTDLAAMERETPVFCNLVRVSSNPCIEITKVRSIWEAVDAGKLQKDTVEFKDGHLLNYNPHPSTQGFASIAFYNGSSWTNEGDFFLIDDKGNLSLKKGKWWDKTTAKATALLSKEKLDQFTVLVNYVDPLRLANFYEYGSSDNPNTKLLIHYKDGTEKTINDDAGKYGTLGLKAIYEKINSFIRNSYWKK